MSQNIDTKPLFILAAAIEAGCAELTVRRSVQMRKIKAELEIINGKPTWILDRQSFDDWVAKRKISKPHQKDDNGLAMQCPQCSSKMEYPDCMECGYIVPGSLAGY